MYVYVHVFLHICLHICQYVHRCTYEYTYIGMHMYTDIEAYTYVCIRTCMHTYVYSERKKEMKSYFMQPAWLPNFQTQAASLLRLTS